MLFRKIPELFEKLIRFLSRLKLDQTRNIKKNTFSMTIKMYNNLPISIKILPLPQFKGKLNDLLISKSQ